MQTCCAHPFLRIYSYFCYGFPRAARINAAACQRALVSSRRNAGPQAVRDYDRYNIILDYLQQRFAEASRGNLHSHGHRFGGRTPSSSSEIAAPICGKPSKTPRNSLSGIVEYGLRSDAECAPHSTDCIKFCSTGV